jgi:hypothetical protein
MRRNAVISAVLLIVVLSGVFAPIVAATPGDGNTTTTTNETTTSTTTEPDNETTNETATSDWSKARLLATVQDHVSRHSDVDVAEMEAWYQSNEDRFSTVEKRYVEAWIEWAKTGEKPLEGLHPSLISDTVTGESPTGPSNVTAADLDRGSKRVSDVVTVRGYEFSDGNMTMVVHADKATTVTVSDQARIQASGRFEVVEYRLEQGVNVIKIPAVTYEGDQMILVRDGMEGVPLQDEDPPFLQSVIAEYLWVSAGAVLLVTGLYSIQWFLRREKIYEQFRPAALLIAGQVQSGGGFVNRFVGDDDDEKPDDAYDDGIRGLIQRYASLRSIASTAVKVGLIAAVAHSIGWIDLPVPSMGDPAKIALSFAALTYLVGAPTVIKPVLEAVYNPNLEKIQVLDDTGKKSAGHWAKKGTFKSDYEVEESAKGGVPTRVTTTGQTAYLVSDIDRDARKVTPAFAWQVEQVAEIDGLEDAEVDWMGDTIAIDQILSDPTNAAYVIQDMLVEARNGKELRKAFPFVRMRDSLDEAKEIAMGINRAVSGGSVEGILSDMIDSYESKQEQVEEKYEQETDLEKSLDEVAEELGVNEETDENTEGGENDE